MLYVCPTPIGNLGDITLRALDVLRSVELVACEDTRHTGRLLGHFDIHVRLLSYQEHNEAERVGVLLPMLREGRDVALVSDAGMPGLSDPGFVLVRACLEEGVPVTVLPGASSVDTALVASGLPTDRFTFLGFLPRGRGKVVGAVEAADRAGGTIVAFESPRRLRAGLEALAERWPDRTLAVCRELSKLHEQVVRGTPAQVLAGLAEEVRGEVVLVLAPADAGPAAGASAEARDDAVRQVLAALLTAGRPTKEAARLVAALTGMPQREAYAAALKVREARS